MNCKLAPCWLVWQICEHSLLCGHWLLDKNECHDKGGWWLTLQIWSVQLLDNMELLKMGVPEWFICHCSLDSTCLSDTLLSTVLKSLCQALSKKQQETSFSLKKKFKSFLVLVSVDYPLVFYNWPSTLVYTGLVAQATKVPISRW